MKRILATAILLIYCVSVSALSLNLHFCGDYLNHISFGVDNHGKCCCDNKPLNDNCCEDFAMTFSVPQDHFLSEEIGCPESAFESVLNYFPAEIVRHINFFTTQHLHQFDTEPPDKLYSNSIFLLYNNLRI